MITVRKSEERGRADHGWLDTRHTFSFADYYDPTHMGFRSLRVINEDRVAPGAGFPTHPHRDMEIITLVMEGELAHRDTSGGAGTLGPGEVQHMTAGTGVRHSEMNASDEAPVHLFQIWLLPDHEGLAPGYEQTRIPLSERRGRLRPLVTPDGREGSLKVHQDVALFGSVLGQDEEVHVPLQPGRHAWIQVARGALDVNGVRLEEGDGAAVSDEPDLRILARRPAELLLFDLA